MKCSHLLLKWKFYNLRNGDIKQLWSTLLNLMDNLFTTIMLTLKFSMEPQNRHKRQVTRQQRTKIPRQKASGGSRPLTVAYLTKVGRSKRNAAVLHICETNVPNWSHRINRFIQIHPDSSGHFQRSWCSWILRGPLWTPPNFGSLAHSVRSSRIAPRKCQNSSPARRCPAVRFTAPRGFVLCIPYRLS